MCELTGRVSNGRGRRTPDAKRARPRCLQCGFEVQPKAWGCKNPCANCGFVYPLGDCSD